MDAKIRVGRGYWGGAEPFKGVRFRQMNEDESKMFLQAVMVEAKNGPSTIAGDDFDLPFEARVVLKRIAVMELPINFSEMGVLAACVLGRNVGGAVTALIDALNLYEGELMTVEKVSQLYPLGFYDEPTFEIYVDDYLKKRRIMWSEIY